MASVSSKPETNQSEAMVKMLTEQNAIVRDQIQKMPNVFFDAYGHMIRNAGKVVTAEVARELVNHMKECGLYTAGEISLNQHTLLDDAVKIESPTLELEKIIIEGILLVDQLDDLIAQKISEIPDDIQ